METFSALLAFCAGNSPVTGEFPTQRPVTWSFNFFFDLHLKWHLGKQCWGWWFETPSHPLWRYCNENCMFHGNAMPWKRFQHYRPFVSGNNQSLMDSPLCIFLKKTNNVKFWYFLCCQPKKCWTNSRVVGDLIRHDVMWCHHSTMSPPSSSTDRDGMNQHRH